VQYKPLKELTPKAEKDQDIKITEVSFRNAYAFLEKYSLILSWKDPSRVKFSENAFSALYTDRFDFENTYVQTMFQYLAEFPSTSLREAVSKQKQLPLSIVKTLIDQATPTRDTTPHNIIARCNQDPTVLSWLFTSANPSFYGYEKLVTCLANNINTPDIILTNPLLTEYAPAGVAGNPKTPKAYLIKLVDHIEHNVHFIAVSSETLGIDLKIIRLNKCLEQCKKYIEYDRNFADEVQRLLFQGGVKLVLKETFE
jgi:hypothetical protein